MEVIINNINIYHINDNRYHINNRHNSSGIFLSHPKLVEGNLSDFTTHIVVNDDKTILSLKS